MPPAKSSRNHDDSKADAAHPKEKNGGHLTATKMRRMASQNSASHAREVLATAPTSAASQAVPVEAQAPNLQWSSFDRDVLHAYRREHNLNTPTCFTHTYHDWVLSNPASIGVHSPTMARKLKARRQGKENLARTVRKHFNGVGVQENDVIVDFIHKIHSEKFARSEGPNRQAIVTAQ